MGYKPQLDKKLQRNRLLWDKWISNLIPVWGSGVGTGNPGQVFLNTSGSPLMVDPMNEADRLMTADALIIGPKGSGKSSTLVYLCCAMMAIHKPHLVIIDAGSSFKLFGDYMRANGFSVNHVHLTPDSGVSLPPFADALRMLEGYDHMGWPGVVQVRDDQRDILLEMESSAQYMITGGEQRELQRWHPEDRMTLREALLLAAQQTRERGGRTNHGQ